VITNCEFGQSASGSGDISRAGGTGCLADRLSAAQRALESAGVDDRVRARFQRRLTAICDALKAPGADVARCERRLDLLLADLGARAGASGEAGATEQAGHD
jgi:hypothetical protein